MNDPVFPKPEGPGGRTPEPAPPETDGDSGGRLPPAVSPGTDGFASQLFLSLSQVGDQITVVPAIGDSPGFIDGGLPLSNVDPLRSQPYGFSNDWGLLYSPSTRNMANNDLSVCRFAPRRAIRVSAVGFWLDGFTAALTATETVQVGIYTARGDSQLRASAIKSWASADALFPPSTTTNDVPQIKYFNLTSPLSLNANTVYAMAVRFVVGAGGLPRVLIASQAASDLFSGLTKYTGTRRYNPAAGVFSAANYGGGSLPADIRMGDAGGDGGPTIAAGPAASGVAAQFWLASAT